MNKEFGVKAPFFEIGPKLYMWGDRIVELAKEADRLVPEYKVDIMMTVQYTDIQNVKSNTKNIKVLAQHMDSDYPGRGMGKILPEALLAAGADGVMLNHAEHPLTMDVLEKTMKRADEVGLGTVVCAGSIEEAKAIAKLGPNIIVVEDPKLIGTGIRNSEDQKNAEEAMKRIKEINPEILVLLGAGISNEKDVYEVMLSGSDGTGSTSGIMKADSPEEMTRNMAREIRRGYEESLLRKE